jgi:hypothetical protein
MVVDSRFTAEVVGEVRSIMAEKGGALGKWNRIKSVFEKHHVLSIRTAHPDEVMVHPKNRGGLGLNAHEVHRVLAAVKRIEGDKSQVTTATAFEIAPDAETSSKQRAFNSAIIAGSAGLLAPLTGRERLLSVSCSHFTAACRAVQHGCRSDHESLVGADGHMHIGAVANNDEVLADLISNGFQWQIIPAVAEQIFGPELADLAQGALNAVHGVATQQSELQIVGSMAVWVSEHPDATWDEVVQRAAESAPPCTPYLKVLATFVRLYSGGDGAPMVKYSCTELT